MELAEETDTVKLCQDIKSETAHIKKKRICAFATVCGGALLEQGAKSDEVGQALAFSFLKNLFQNFNLDFTLLSLYNFHSKSSNIV